MTTIMLNVEKTYDKGRTTKYWREITCHPQKVDLKTWSSNHPMFTLKGVITKSHDPKEIGQQTETTIQSYSFWLQEDIEKGVYSIN
jgi:hypothetical protein